MTTNQKNLAMKQNKIISTEDPLVALVEVAKAIATNLIKIPWNANVFGRDRDVPFHMYMFDLLENSLDMKEINILLVSRSRMFERVDKKTKRRVNWVLNKNCAFNIFPFNIKDQLKLFPLFSNKHNKIKRVEKRKLHKVFILVRIKRPYVQLLIF